MPFIATTGGGVVQGTGNVEKMPPTMAPVPFPSIANLAKLDPQTCSQKVKILNKHIVLQKTMIPMTNGDAPSGSGVISNGSMGPAEVSGGLCTKVLVEG